MVKCFNPDVVAVGQLLKQLFPVCAGAFCLDLFFAWSRRSFCNKNDQSAQLLFNVFYFIRFIHRVVKVAGVKDDKKMDEKNVLPSHPALSRRPYVPEAQYILFPVLSAAGSGSRQVSRLVFCEPRHFVWLHMHTYTHTSLQAPGPGCSLSRDPPERHAE